MLTAPTTISLDLNILESGKRKLASPVCKQEPITTKLLIEMFQSYMLLEMQRISELSVHAWQPMLPLPLPPSPPPPHPLRSNELLSIRRCDVLIERTHMSIFIESSKTDKYRDGT